MVAFVHNHHLQASTLTELYANSNPSKKAISKVAEQKGTPVTPDLAGVGVSTAFIKTHFEDAAPWHAIDHLGRLPPSGSEPISSQGRCGRVHVIPVSSLPETGDEGLAGFPVTGEKSG